MHQVQTKNPAEIYDDYFVPAMFQPWAAQLLVHARLQAGERVLDVACGTGVVARRAAQLVGDKGHVTGVDINPPMLGVARSLPVPNGAAVTWQEGNALSLPFADAAFDAALCQHGLQFFPDRTLALKEMHRVLAPGGRAVVIVLQSLAQHPVFEALMTSVAHHLALPLATVATPFALSDAATLENLFAAARFGQVELITASITARFPDPKRFVPLAVASSAAAVPAFAQLQEPARAALIEAVRLDVQPTMRRFVAADMVAFPMSAHIVRAVR